LSAKSFVSFQNREQRRTSGKAGRERLTAGSAGRRGSKAGLRWGLAATSRSQLWPAPGQAWPDAAAAACPRQQAAQRPARRRQQPAGDRATEEMAQRSSARPGIGGQSWLGRQGAGYWSAMELQSLSMVAARTGERRETLGRQREWGGE